MRVAEPEAVEAKGKAPRRDTPEEPPSEHRGGARSDAPDETTPALHLTRSTGTVHGHAKTRRIARLMVLLRGKSEGVARELGPAARPNKIYLI